MATPFKQTIADVRARMSEEERQAAACFYGKQFDALDAKELVLFLSMRQTAKAMAAADGMDAEKAEG